MMDRAPEDIRRAEEEAEHCQLEAESLVEAARDRDMMDYEEGQRLRDLDDLNRTEAWKMAYDGDPYWRWGDYELDLGLDVTPVEIDFDHFERFCDEANDALGIDETAEASDMGEDIPEYLDWGYMGL